MELHKTNQQKEKCPREGTRIRDAFIHKPKNPIKNTKLEAVIYTPEDLVQTCAGFFSLCEFIQAFLS